MPGVWPLAALHAEKSSRKSEIGFEFATRKSLLTLTNIGDLLYIDTGEW